MTTRIDVEEAQGNAERLLRIRDNNIKRAKSTEKQMSALRRDMMRASNPSVKDRYFGTYLKLRDMLAGYEARAEKYGLMREEALRDLEEKRKAYLSEDGRHKPFWEKA